MTVEPELAKSDARKILDLILDPVLEYGRAMRAWSDAHLLARRIVADQLDVGALGKFLLAAAVLSTFIGKLLPDESGPPLWSVDVPIIDDAISLLSLALTGVLTGLIVYLPIRRLGGAASLRHTLIASIYTSAALLPPITLVSGLWWQLSDRPLPASATSVAVFYYLMKLLADMHRVPFGRAFVLGLAACLAAALPLGMVLIIVLGLSH
jgi:hypothetical protein